VFAGVMAVCLTVYLPLGALLPVLPLYVRDELREGDVAVGLVVGGFGFVALLCRPFAGSLTDRIDRRRVAGAGAILCALSGTLYFVPGLAGAGLARVLLGVGEALATSATMAWAIDLAPAGRRGRMIGLFGLAIWTGLSLGAPIGVALNGIGYEAVWLFAIAAPLAGGLLALALPGGGIAAPEPLPPVRRLVPRGVVAPGLGAMLVTIGAGVIEAFIVLHLVERGLDRAGSGSLGALVYTTFAASIVVTRIAAGGLVDRFGGARTAGVSCLVEAAGLALIATAAGVPAVFAGAALTGAAIALLYPALALVAVDAAPESRRGAAAASFTAFADVGFAAGSVAGGLIASRAGYADAFWFGAVCALATLVIALALRRRAAAASGAVRPSKLDI
jgi:MFS family permease